MDPICFLHILSFGMNTGWVARGERGVVLTTQPILRAAGRRRLTSTLLRIVARMALAQLAGLGLLVATVIGEGGGGPLLPCGTSGDFVTDQRQVVEVFEFVKGVCAQRGESCPSGAPLPTSCDSAECQRAVQLADDSCRSAFAPVGFLRAAFEPILNATAAVCAAAPQPADAQVRSREELLVPRPAPH